MKQDNKPLNNTQRYGLMGFGFGPLFPILAIVIRIVGSELPFNVSSLISVHLSDPLLWIIDTAPIFLGFFASLAGRRQDQLTVLNVQLRQRENELVEERDNLEKHVEERTNRLNRKTDQLRSAS